MELAGLEPATFWVRFGRACGLGRLGVCLGFAAATLIALAAPSTAAGQGCPSADTSYTGNCGPTFTVPSWGDAGGWTDPSKYSTIQLGDVNGDGRDELIGRNDAGLEIFRFDTTLGQWRPQVDANGLPQVLEDFASPSPPQESTPCSWHDPSYYMTIQTGDVDGQSGEEIVARFCDGIRTFKYSAPAGGQNIDGGTWKRISTAGPYSDADGYDDPSLYPTIHLAQLRSGDPAILFAREHSKPGDPSLAFYAFDPACLGAPSCWDERNDAVSGFSDQECGQPACYLDLETADVSPWAEDQLTDIIGRNKFGLSAFSGDPFVGWTMVGGSAGVAGSFADVASSDCPFSSSGASGPGSGDCLGSSPSYYETLRGANIDGLQGDELIARASDGLRVRVLGPEAGFSPGATLTALAGAASTIQPGQWGSIRTGDIDGDGKQEVLALDGTGLQAWSYDWNDRVWNQLQPSTPLALAADPWLSRPEYYSTLQTGDVDGDGRDDVIARGPFGIRTWFYNRRETGGWERYLPDGYPAFATAGQQAAFTALTALAVTNSAIPDDATSVRDAWTSLYPPDPGYLTTLQSGLASIANCTGQAPGNPPSYQACTPPAGSSGFTAADWTAVVNQMLSESYAAGQVVALFAQLQRMRASLFIADRGDLPDLNEDLGLPGAAGSTAQFSGMRLWELTFGIAGALASTGSSAAAAAPLSVASSLVSALPSSSPTAVSSFSATYGGLQDTFTKMANEIDNGILVQSQQIREDAGLLGLVSQLRSGGTWALDANGIESAATQGFAIWAYEELMPTLYDRYQITDCQNTDWGTLCQGVPAGPGVIGGGVNFTTIGPRYVRPPAGPPCSGGDPTDDPLVCNYVTPPSDVMDAIWGPITPDCTYQPGNPQSEWWTYGCSAGVDVNTSIGSNTWGFTSLSGDLAPIPPSGASATAAGRARPGPAIALGRRRYGRQPARRGHAYLRRDTLIPRRVRLAGATVSMPRLLFERGARGELTRARRSRAPRPLKLRRTAPGRFTAARNGRPRVRITLRRVGRRARVALALRISARRFRVPRVCHALPAATALDTPPFELESRLRISDGRTRRLIRLIHPLRCARDDRGNVSRVVGVRPRRYPARGGLAVTLRGPRRVRPGGTARYIARVHNRRRRGRGLRSSLWDVALHVRRGRTIRIAEVRPGRSRRLMLSRRVPRSARHRFCVDAAATAAGARVAHAKACAAVGAARPPGVTG